MQSDAPAVRTPCIVVFFAWLIVCVPAGWGVTQTVMRSMELFKPSAAIATATSQPAKN